MKTTKFVGITLPIDLYDRVKKESLKDHRSVSSFIAMTLDENFPKDNEIKGYDNEQKRRL